MECRGAEWTKKHKPIAIIHFEEFESEIEALNREKYFKSGSGREFLDKIYRERKEKFEPAASLLEKIKAEKAALTKSTKKIKELPPISDDEKPFTLPEGWVWCRLGELVDEFKYGSSKKS